MEDDPAEKHLVGFFLFSIVFSLIIYHSKKLSSLRSLGFSDGKWVKKVIRAESESVSPQSCPTL